MSDSVLQIRVSEEERDRFKKFAEELGIKQGSALTEMLNAYELSKTANLLPDTKNDIENFTSLVAQLQRLYTTAVHSIERQKDIAYENLRVDLESKDKVIQNLQERLEIEEKKLQNFYDVIEENNALRKENEDKTQALEALEIVRQSIPDVKEIQNQRLELARLQAKVEEQARTIEILSKLHTRDE